MEDLKGQIAIKNPEISNSWEPLPGRDKENISCYQILDAGVTWEKLEASSKETRAIGEIFCCLKMQPEKEEHMPSSLLSSAILQSHVGIPTDETQLT